jgi:hypothetical protein
MSINSFCSLKGYSYEETRVKNNEEKSTEILDFFPSNDTLFSRSYLAQAEPLGYSSPISSFLVQACSSKVQEAVAVQIIHQALEWKCYAYGFCGQ